MTPVHWTSFGIHSNSSGHSICTFPIFDILFGDSFSFYPPISSFSFLSPPPPRTPAVGFERDMTKPLSYLTSMIAVAVSQCIIPDALASLRCTLSSSGLVDPDAFSIFFPSKLSFIGTWRIYFCTRFFAEYNPSACSFSPSPNFSVYISISWMLTLGFISFRLFLPIPLVFFLHRMLCYTYLISSLGNPTLLLSVSPISRVARSGCRSTGTKSTGLANEDKFTVMGIGS